jgi:ABC-type multidrug transport system fused ATPase/permease subunit
LPPGGRLEVLEAGVAAHAPPAALGVARGQIVFDDVWFTYRGGSPVLTGVDLEVRAGERISLIGRSGAGKTTLLRLLLSFVQPQRGRIYLDGQDLAALPDRTAHRRQFGVVTQQDVLFNVTLRENLTFGLTRAAADPQLEQALQATNLWEEVSRLPEGLSTLYRPDMFSVGQKQRLFIARALLRDPSIVLLDEPTSALDFQNEGLVLRAIEELMAGKTTMTVTHRLSTLRAADRVVVLEAGMISAAGSHECLYETNRYYRDLCEYNSFVV